MADGLVVLDAEGRVLVYSPPAEALLGLEAGRLAVGARVEELAGLLEVAGQRRSTAAPDAPVVALGPQHTVHAELTRLPAITAGGTESVLIVLRDARIGAALQTQRRDFMNDISHEMRTPLAAIRGASATLLAGALGDGEQARHFVGVIEQHAVRLGQVLEDVGSLVNLEHGDVPLCRRPLAVARTLAAALRGCRDAALSWGVGLEWHVARDTPPLDGDRDMVAQVLMRLVDLTVRATPRGGTVRLTAEGSAVPDRDGTWVRLQLLDAGRERADDTGLAPEEQVAPLNAARFRERGGGLGLALVHHIVRVHGGSLQLAERPGERVVAVLVWPAASELTTTELGGEG